MEGCARWWVYGFSNDFTNEAAEQSGRARTRGPGGSKQVGAVVGRGIVWCVVEGHGIEGTRVDTVKPPPKNLDME